MTGMDQEAVRRFAAFRADPVKLVREQFGVEPDPWQAEALRNYPKSPRLVMKACKGPGKSAVLSWIGWHFLLTRPHAIGGCTSVNADNLKTGLWTEFARWREKSPLLTAMFEQTKTTIFAREYPQTWKLEARSWARDEIGRAHV